MIRIALLFLALVSTQAAAADRCLDLAHRERSDPRHVFGYNTADIIDDGFERYNKSKPWEKQFSPAELGGEVEAYITKACKRLPKSTPIQTIVEEYFAKMARWFGD